MRRIKLFTHPLAAWLALGSLGFIAGVIIAACTSSGIVCSRGLTRCGLGCADFTSDSQNCGACGVACQSLQVCQNSGCQCRAGATLCAGSCVITSSDSQNCGGCIGDGGVACAAGQVCDLGQCKAQCTTPLVPCASGCVDLQSDPNNCSACGHSCSNVQSCRNGQCSYDIVAACFNTGQVVGIQASTNFLGPLALIGTGPQALAAARGFLLVADGIDRKLLQARLSDLNHVLTNAYNLGSSPNHIFVDDPYIYVVNSFGDTLQVFQRADDGGTGDAGLSLIPATGPDGGINFGAGTSPQSIAKLGNNLYIPLYGAITTGAGAGVAQVDVSNPLSPSLIRVINVSSLVSSFDGGATLPRPSGVTTFQGRVYVALSNLVPPPPYSRAGGPGTLARIDPDGGTTAVNLGNDCHDAYWVSSDGNVLYVSCGGSTDYSQSPPVTQNSGLVMVNDQGQRTAFWDAGCGGVTDCAPPSAGRFGVFGNQIYIGDNNAGRVFVLQKTDGGLAEIRGYTSVGGPLVPCPVDPTTRQAYVSDVIPIP